MMSGLHCSTGEMIATSANQIVPLKFWADLQKCCTIFARPPFPLVGSGDETRISGDPSVDPGYLANHVLPPLVTPYFVNCVSASCSSTVGSQARLV